MYPITRIVSSLLGMRKKPDSYQLLACCSYKCQHSLLPTFQHIPASCTFPFKPIKRNGFWFWASPRQIVDSRKSLIISRNFARPENLDAKVTYPVVVTQERLRQYPDYMTSLQKAISSYYNNFYL
jgi:hypothetical protein